MPEPNIPDTGPASEVPPPPEGGSLIDSITELIQSLVTYVRQQAGDAVHDKVVVPIQKAGGTLGMAIAVGILVALGLAFVSVGALILLAQWLTWPGALFLVGGVLILGSAIVAFIRVRSLQR